MPQTHVTKVFAAKDAKMYPLTADPAGGSPTYGTGLDIPGLKTVSISGDINVAELRGDNTLLDKQSSIGGITVGLEFAKSSLDILAAIFATAVADTGTDPNSMASWTLLGSSTPAYVGLTAQAVGADVIGGDTVFSCYKLMISSFPEMGLEEEDYKTASLEFDAVPLLSNNKWIGQAIRGGTLATALAAPA